MSAWGIEMGKAKILLGIGAAASLVAAGVIIPGQLGDSTLPSGQIRCVSEAEYQGVSGGPPAQLASLLSNPTKHIVVDTYSIELPTQEIINDDPACNGKQVGHKFLKAKAFLPVTEVPPGQARQASSFDPGDRVPAGKAFAMQCGGGGRLVVDTVADATCFDGLLPAGFFPDPVEP